VVIIIIRELECSNYCIQCVHCNGTTSAWSLEPRLPKYKGGLKGEKFRVLLLMTKQKSGLGDGQIVSAAPLMLDGLLEPGAA
jgi:hypothetical protein